MICHNCYKEIPDGSAFCSNCGAMMPRTVQTTQTVPNGKARRKISVKAVVLLIVLALILGIAAWRTIHYIQSQQVTEEDLTQMVNSIRESGDGLIRLMNPIVFQLRDGEYIDLSDLDTRMTATSYRWGDITPGIERLMDRQGWKHSKYQEYEDLYRAYRDLYDFMDGIFREDIVYDRLYSRSLAEEKGIPFLYYCEDAKAMQTEYEILVNKYQACLEQIP